ncbi:uncharacterized protein MELLADRAFT_85046 [Melampsora larici-populina 98AG31]|uniref:Uncharacterized protein n=1 Tax=Melampsora larici-populina (strain 98AG31 / pathotype 3-4-7) TaxID=747676 RepID=F4RHA6_MELLP|nr:uncharacterized protein MELLADRAFT_85046 [Melampsora larici-populina 98AG31]EGG08285.1 hypothetical protein MELLADRAFT_85046 [Melampsora larici-populina 98AG31]
MPRLTRTSSRTNGPAEQTASQLNTGSTATTNAQSGSKKKSSKKSKRVTQTETQTETHREENEDETHTNQNHDSTINQDNSDLDEANNLTVDNYTQHMDAWPAGRIRTAIKKYKSSTGTRASSEVQAKAQLAHLKYEHELLMLALVDKVQLRIIKKAIDEVAPKKPSRNLDMYLAYAKDALSLSMPGKGQEDGGVQLGERNRINSDCWKALDDDHKAIFSPSLFYALAGAPNPFAPSESKDLDDEDEDVGDIFVPLPKKMVDNERVSANISKPKAGPSDGLLQRKSLRAFQKHAHELACLANRLNFAYYLVGSSTLTPDKSNELGWTKEFTTHRQVARWANKTSGLARVFATYAQGSAMADAIAEATQGPVKKLKRQRSEKPQRSDIVKVRLGRMLVQLTDPKSALIKRKVPVEMVCLEGVTLSEEALILGFKKMRTEDREKWVEDIKAGLFRLKNIEGVEESDSEGVALNAEDLAEIEKSMDEDHNMNEKEKTGGSDSEDHNMEEEGQDV